MLGLYVVLKVCFVSVGLVVVMLFCFCLVYVCWFFVRKLFRYGVWGCVVWNFLVYVFCVVLVVGCKGFVSCVGWCIVVVLVVILCGVVVGDCVVFWGYCVFVGSCCDWLVVVYGLGWLVIGYLVCVCEFGLVGCWFCCSVWVCWWFVLCWGNVLVVVCLFLLFVVSDVVFVVSCFCWDCVGCCVWLFVCDVGGCSVIRGWLFVLSCWVGVGLGVLVLLVVRLLLVGWGMIIGWICNGSFCRWLVYSWFVWRLLV